MAQLDGYNPNLKTPADIAALPKLALADFTVPMMYQFARQVGVVNIGTDQAPVYEARYTLKNVTVGIFSPDLDLHDYQERMEKTGGVFKLLTRSSTFIVFSSVGMVTFTFSGTGMINWGDGTPPEAYSGGLASHTYPVAPGPYTLTMKYDDYTAVTAITANNCFVTDTSYLSWYPNLVTIVMNHNQLTSTPGLPAGLKTLDCSFNQISGASGLSWALTNLNLSNNPLVNFEPPGNLITLTLDNVLLTATFPLPVTTLKTFSIKNGKFTVAAINDLLVQLDVGGLTGGTFASQGQTPAAAPTGAGATAKTNLITKGWTVTTD